MLKALTDFNIVLILVFVAGAAIGIVSFSHFLSWLLKKYHVTTISALAGIMIGSLVKVWPWQLQIGEVSRPVMPFQPNLEPLFSGHIGLAVTFALIGVALVLVLELTAARMQKKRESEEKNC